MPILIKSKVHMNRCYFLLKSCVLGVFILFGTAFLAIAQEFEGTIHYEIPEMKASGMGEMVYMIKDSKARIEFGEGMQKGAMLFFPEESKSVVIIEQMKGYIMMDQESFQDEDDTSSDFTMEKTGKNKTIAGQSCEVWVIKHRDEQYHVCMAKGLGSFMMPSNPMGGSRNVPRWAEEAITQGVMPLEVVLMKGNQTEMQMKATRITPKSMDATLFEIPDGYKDMSSMMKQMMQRSRRN